jgi:hypothetical protein
LTLLVDARESVTGFWRVKTVGSVRATPRVTMAAMLEERCAAVRP